MTDAVYLRCLFIPQMLMNAFHLNVMLMPSAPTSLAHSSVGVLMVMLEMAGPVLVSKQTIFCLKSGYGEIMILT